MNETIHHPSCARRQGYGVCRCHELTGDQAGPIELAAAVLLLGSLLALLLGAWWLW